MKDFGFSYQETGELKLWQMNELIDILNKQTTQNQGGSQPHNRETYPAGEKFTPLFD